MKVNLIDFMSKGQFGEFGIGDPRQLVISKIGIPMDFSAVTVPDNIWKYGNIEITIGKKDFVVGIFIENENLDSPKNIEIQDYHEMRVLSLQKLNAILDENNIEVVERFFSRSNKEGFLKLPHHVRVTYANGVVTSYSAYNSSFLE